MLPDSAIDPTDGGGSMANSGGGFDWSVLTDIINALGGAATQVIGALRSGTGVINVRTDPTAPGSGILGLDLTTIAIIGIAVYFFMRR